MRQWDFREMEKKILEKTPAAKRYLLRGRRGRIVRRRPRDKEEQNILDLLCKKRWEEAIATGKIKKLSEREWSLEFD